MGHPSEQEAYEAVMLGIRQWPVKRDRKAIRPSRLRALRPASTRFVPPPLRPAAICRTSMSGSSPWWKSGVAPRRVRRRAGKARRPRISGIF